MGILDRIIARGEYKAPEDKPQPEEKQEQPAAAEEKQEPVGVQEAAQNQEVAPAPEAPIAMQQPQPRAGFFGTLASAASYTNQPLPPLKPTLGQENLGAQALF